MTNPFAAPRSSFTERPTTPWMHREAIVNGIRMHYVQAEPTRRVRSPTFTLDCAGTCGGTTTTSSSCDINPSKPPLIVLLHGFPEFYFSWKYQISDFVAAGYRVVAPDLRGYNLTEKPNTGYTLNTLSDDVRHFILHLTAQHASALHRNSPSRRVTSVQSDNSRSTLTTQSAEHFHAAPAEEEDGSAEEPVCLVGHDWGAVIAGAVAARYPRLVSKLVLLQAPHLAAVELARFQKRNPSVPSHRISSIGTLLSFCPPLLPEFLLGCHRSWMMSSLFFQSSPAVTSCTCYSTSEPTDLEEELYRDAMSQPGAVTCMLAYFRNLAVSSLQSRRYGKIQCPVLLVWGGRDRDAGQAHADCLRDACARSVELRIVDHCHGYWIHQEQPDQVNRLVLQFLSGGDE